MIQSDIAEMTTAIEASRALVGKAAQHITPAVEPGRGDRQVPRVADGPNPPTATTARRGRATFRKDGCGEANRGGATDHRRRATGSDGPARSSRVGP